MRALFVDSSYHLAVFNRHDSLHARALRSSADLTQRLDVQFITIEGTLVEFLTFVSRMGREVRLGAVGYVREFRSKPNTIVLPHTRQLFDAALDLYERRPDKRYSMTDCMGMVICRERAIREVLTYDRDFEQEGFVALLRHP